MTTYISRLFGHAIGNSLFQSLEVLVDKPLVFENHCECDK